MFKKIKDLKKKIKLAKIGITVLAILFILLILNSICLTYKVYKLEKQINYSEITNMKKCGIQK